MEKIGFNFLWMFSKGSGREPKKADERALDFLARHGFDFVRVPTDYRFWTEGTEYFSPNERILEIIDQYVEAIGSRGLHMCLNIHRAPGYCINSNNLETHNLWRDEVAQEAFAFLWETFARRYRGIPSEKLSFNLLNEPPSLGKYGFTREAHEMVMRRATAAIRAVDPERTIVVDGIAGGNLAVPELADLGAVHSGRGYQPMTVTHHEADWWADRPEGEPPVYPGTEWDGIVWNRDTLAEFYRPWREVESLGVPVHIGEFGCYDQTPNDVALRWFADVVSVYRENGWGYALWQFEGPFGIVGHGRPGARFETIDGYQVDRDLFEILRPR